MYNPSEVKAIAFYIAAMDPRARAELEYAMRRASVTFNRMRTDKGQVTRSIPLVRVFSVLPPGAASSLTDNAFRHAMNGLSLTALSGMKSAQHDPLVLAHPIVTNASKEAAAAGVINAAVHASDSRPELASDIDNLTSSLVSGDEVVGGFLKKALKKVGGMASKALPLIATVAKTAFPALSPVINTVQNVAGKLLKNASSPAEADKAITIAEQVGAAQEKAASAAATIPSAQAATSTAMALASQMSPHHPALSAPKESLAHALAGASEWTPAHYDALISRVTDIQKATLSLATQIKSLKLSNDKAARLALAIQGDILHYEAGSGDATGDEVRDRMVGAKPFSSSAADAAIAEFKMSAFDAETQSMTASTLTSDLTMLAEALGSFPKTALLVKAYLPEMTPMQGRALANLLVAVIEQAKTTVAVIQGVQDAVIHYLDPTIPRNDGVRRDDDNRGRGLRRDETKPKRSRDDVQKAASKASSGMRAKAASVKRKPPMAGVRPSNRRSAPTASLYSTAKERALRLLDSGSSGSSMLDIARDGASIAKAGLSSFKRIGAKLFSDVPTDVTYADVLTGELIGELFTNGSLDDLADGDLTGFIADAINGAPGYGDSEVDSGLKLAMLAGDISACEQALRDAGAAGSGDVEGTGFLPVLAAAGKFLAPYVVSSVVPWLLNKVLGSSSSATANAADSPSPTPGSPQSVIPGSAMAQAAQAGILNPGGSFLLNQNGLLSNMVGHQPWANSLTAFLPLDDREAYKSANLQFASGDVGGSDTALTGDALHKSGIDVSLPKNYFQQLMDLGRALDGAHSTIMVSPTSLAKGDVHYAPSSLVGAIAALAMPTTVMHADVKSMKGAYRGSGDVDPSYGDVVTGAITNWAKASGRQAFSPGSGSSGSAMSKLWGVISSPWMMPALAGASYLGSKLFASDPSSTDQKASAPLPTTPAPSVVPDPGGIASSTTGLDQAGEFSIRIPL